MNSEQTPLGIIAGSGLLPRQLAETCKKQGRPVFVLGFDSITDMQPFSGMAQATVRLGAIGGALDALRQAGAMHVVLAGGFKRPSILGLRPDMAAVKMLIRLGRKWASGDDTLLSGLIALIEEQGFRVIGAQDVDPELLAPEGALGSVAPNSEDQKDIAEGVRAARDLGSKDIGQAVIVENGKVLCTEDAKGTNALIARTAAHKQKTKGGVLVKMKKPHQETRVDLPAIGPQTVENAYGAGLHGIAVEAGASIILSKAETIAKADELGIFIVGVRA